MSQAGGSDDERRARLEAELNGGNDFTLSAMFQQFQRWTTQFEMNVIIATRAPNVQQKKSF